MKNRIADPGISPSRNTSERSFSWLSDRSCRSFQCVCASGECFPVFSTIFLFLFLVYDGGAGSVNLLPAPAQNTKKRRGWKELSGSLANVAGKREISGVESYLKWSANGEEKKFVNESLCENFSFSSCWRSAAVVAAAGGGGGSSRNFLTDSRERQRVEKEFAEHPLKRQRRISCQEEIARQNKKKTSRKTRSLEDPESKTRQKKENFYVFILYGFRLLFSQHGSVGLGEWIDLQVGVCSLAEFQKKS